jgi:hypothetical protein
MVCPMRLEITNPIGAIAVRVGIALVILAARHPVESMSLLGQVLKSVIGRSLMWQSWQLTIGDF